MPLKLVTYDLSLESRRPPIVKVIKEEFGGWARLSESSYAVLTDLTVSQIHQKLSRLIDKDDNLYVIALSQPYSGFGPKEVNGFLRQNL